jgi:4-amino-4-deoxy-L-arabinose transferase-like glycosyltransferase
MNILDGELLLYFPLNDGEPLYNYVVAAGMSLFGENLFALRTVNVWAGLLLVAAAFLWASWAFDRQTGLFTAALLAVSFWPVAASRQALRAGMLPLLITAAVIFFWLIVRQAQMLLKNESTSRAGVHWWAVTGFAAFIGLTLYTYLAARVLWIIFPIFLLYLAIFHRHRFVNTWRPTLIGLLAAGLLVVPMFAYVRAHPEADTRLDMLDGPLRSLLSGEIRPILANAGEAFLSFFWPGSGDRFLAYNIPGRPLFTVVSAGMFLIGLGVCLWRWRKPACAFLIIWFAVGILPSLITGPTANTTRNSGAMTAVYILPALGFITLKGWLSYRWGKRAAQVAGAFGLIWILFITGVTVRDYFNRWAGDPDVRAAYQQNLVQSLDYLDSLDVAGPAVISSVYPGAVHDPSIARVLEGSEGLGLRWVDSRYGLISPSMESAILIVPGSTPLHPAFQEWVRQIDEVTLRTGDLDPIFRVYTLEIDSDPSGPSVNFGDALLLREAHWLRDSTQPGETAELLTLWEVLDPDKVGPQVLPAFETDVVLFTHVLNDEGEILTQQDRLEAPSWDWQTGDIFVQIHPLAIPAETVQGQYETIVGIFDRESGVRLPVLDLNGEISGTVAVVVPLTVK